MRVAIYTDASIKGKAGWWAGVIIRGDDEPVEHCGTLKGNFKSSTAVELAAICNALHRARSSGLIAPGDSVHLWCDNETAVHRTNGRYHNRMKTDPMMIEATRWIKEFRKANRLEIRARHVKGHQPIGGDCLRSMHNRRCDQLCAARRRGIEAMSYGDFLEREELFRERRLKREMRAAA